MINKREDGSAVLENILVLPIVFLVIFIILTMLLVTFDRAVLDAATQRGTVQARKMIEDPYYIGIVKNSIESSSSELKGSEALGDVTEVGDINSISITMPEDGVQPYRYFFMDSDYIEGVAKEKVLDYINKLNFPISNSKVEVFPDVSNMIFYTGIEIVSTRTYDLPFNDLGFDLGDLVVESRSYTIVTDPDEFVRNVDLANEVLYDLGVTGSDGKLEQMFDKVKDMLDRFFK